MDSMKAIQTCSPSLFFAFFLFFFLSVYSYPLLSLYVSSLPTQDSNSIIYTKVKKL